VSESLGDFFSLLFTFTCKSGHSLPFARAGVKINFSGWKNRREGIWVLRRLLSTQSVGKEYFFKESSQASVQRGLFVSLRFRTAAGPF
jgi:hypothetical protein